MIIHDTIFIPNHKKVGNSLTKQEYLFEITEILFTSMNFLEIDTINV